MTLDIRGAHLCIKNMKKTIDYLLANGFSKNDVFKNFDITVYPLENIRNSMEQTEDEEFVAKQYDVDINELDRSQILNLCLLILQKAHDYTGDGCWPDNKLLDQDDIPDEKQLLDILNAYKEKKFCNGYWPQ